MQKSSRPASAVVVALADHPARTLICSHLEHDHFHVLEADDLESCLAAVRQSNASLIIVGHPAQGLDSTALCAQIRAAPEAQHCSLLLIHQTTPPAVALDQLTYLTSLDSSDADGENANRDEVRGAAGLHALSHPQMEPFFQQLAQGVVIFDRIGRLILTNAAAERILWGDRDAALTHGADAELEWLLEERFVERAQTTFERHHRRPDGSFIDIQVATMPVGAMADIQHGYAAIITDISERKRVEKLEREQRRMGESFSAITSMLAQTRDPDLIWQGVLDHVGQIVEHDTANIMLIDGDVARVKYTRGYSADLEAIIRSIAFSLDITSFMQMARTGEPYRVDNVFEDPEWLVFLNDQAPTRAYLAVPIRIHDRVIGFVNLDSMRFNAFSAQDGERLQTFVNQVANAIEHAQLYDAIQPNDDQMRALYNATAFLFASHLVSSETIEHLGRQIVDAVVREFDQVACTLMLVDQAHLHLVLLAHAGGGCPDPEPYILLSSDQPIVQAVRGRSSVLVPKPTDAATEGAVQCAQLIIPLRAGKEVLGVLQLRSVNEAALGPQQQQILRVFTERAAAALENLHLYQQIRRYADELEVRVQERTAEISRIKERVEAILNHSSDAIFLVRPDGRIQQVNDSFKQQFGFQYDDVYGIPVETLIDDASAPQLRDILERVIASNQAERVELTARTQSGANFEADMMLSPLTAPPDKVIGVVCSIRDISERKQLEASLRAALEKEREVNEMQAQFIMRASHEFRTPLSVISTASDLLLLYESRMTDEQKHEKLEQVQNEVKTLTKMLDDMLIVSRGQTAREVTFDPKPFDLAALCQEIVTELESTIGAAHQFVCSYAGSAETLTADRKLIRRLLVNLLSNAVKFSAPGSKIYLSTTCEPTVTKISVTDEGIGIPPEDQKRLFQPFHRGGHVEGIEGTGLGLAIVKQSVEVHRGTVSFESVPGTGTTFVVTLPTVSSGDMEL